MSDFDQKGFVSALKCYIPNNVTLQNESVAKLCSIIRDIHSSFANAILSKAEDEQASEISANIVQESIDPLLPENLKRYAFANAMRHLALYQARFIGLGENKMTNDATESMENEGTGCKSDELNSSVAMMNREENNEIQKEEPKTKSLLNLVWQWLCPTTEQNQAENNEKAESRTGESSETDETTLVVGDKIRTEESNRKSLIQLAWQWLSPTTLENQTEHVEKTESRTGEFEETDESNLVESDQIQTEL